MPKRTTQTNLVAAAHKGDLALVKELIQNGADVNFRAPMGTPLSVAARYGFKEIAQVLIAAGADVNSRTKPLSQAIEHNHPEIACALIKAGADVAKAATCGLPILAAAALGHSEVVQALIAAGADVNTQGDVSVIKDRFPDTVGCRVTALIIAAKCGHIEIVETLIGAQAKLDFKDGEGETAFDWARKNGHTGIVKLLQEQDSGGGRQRRMNNFYVPRKQTTWIRSAISFTRVPTSLHAMNASPRRAQRRSWSRPELER